MDGLLEITLVNQTCQKTLQSCYSDQKGEIIGSYLQIMNFIKQDLIIYHVVIFT
jgi:hypothetical protein